MIDVNIMPLARLMGIRLVEQSPDRVVAEMTVREDLCTTNSILHGGAYMAFADTIGAVATVLNLPAGARTTTVESKTNFISAIKAGEVARAECTLPEIAAITGHSLKSIYQILKHYLSIDEKLADNAIRKLLDYMEREGMAV